MPVLFCARWWRGMAAKAADGPNSLREAASRPPLRTCYSRAPKSSLSCCRRKPDAARHSIDDAVTSEGPLLMVVDDDPSALLLVDVLSEKMGFRVKAVSSGLQALEHLRDGLQPSVILL